MFNCLLLQFQITASIKFLATVKNIKTGRAELINFL